MAVRRTQQAASRLLAALAVVLMAAQVGATETSVLTKSEQYGLGRQAGNSLFRFDTETLFDSGQFGFGQSAVNALEVQETEYLRFSDWRPEGDAPVHWSLHSQIDLYRLAAADRDPIMPPEASSGPYPEQLPASEAETPSYGRMFFKGWALITSVELVLLAVTAMLPKSWTGWSSTFVADGMGNLKEAYTMPPVWDTDHWFHNYVGHPYGGSVYYNTVRCQGANPGQSFLFSTALSVQWEYIFEAVAERPSIQDLFITPITGSLLGEAVHHLTLSLKRHGTNFFEKVIILFLNPGSVIFNGFG